MRQFAKSANWSGIIPILCALAGCGTVTTEGPVKTVTVNVAVPVSCIPSDYPPAPIYTDTKSELKAAADFAARMQMVDANWALRDDRLALDEKTIDVCRKAAPPETLTIWSETMDILAYALVLPCIFLAIAIPSSLLALWCGAPWREVVNCFLPACLRV